MGLTAGVSAARGRYADRVVEGFVGAPRLQRLTGADLGYSRGRWQVRAEAVAGSWDAPIGDPATRDLDLDAWAAMVELRVKVMSGLSVAGRADRLHFGSIASRSGLQSWDYAVTRGEAGIQYLLRRHVVLKTSVQHNQRAGGRVRRQTFIAGQVLLWF
jgi:hypothetical protein